MTTGSKGLVAPEYGRCAPPEAADTLTLDVTSAAAADRFAPADVEREEGDTKSRVALALRTNDEMSFRQCCTSTNVSAVMLDVEVASNELIMSDATNTRTSCASFS